MTSNVYRLVVNVVKKLSLCNVNTRSCEHSGDNSGLGSMGTSHVKQLILIVSLIGSKITQKTSL